MSDTTGVYVHHSRYPIRVLSKLAKVDSSVRRLDPLFRYEANAGAASGSASASASASGSSDSSSQRSSSKGKEREQQQQQQQQVSRSNSHSSSAPGGSSSPKLSTSNYFGGNKEEDRLSLSEIFTFESPIEGTLSQWCAEEGKLLDDPGKPILRILEPCKHPVQLGGLCAVCGKDLTGVDYTGFSETSRANIQMTHDTSALTVSLEEAARLEQQTSSRLTKEKKLSLIVDLDQTIIHATVDPTVGEWMHDEHNPNYSVLRDVQKFRLLNEAGKEDGCWYYVKPRPNLHSFLDTASKLFEMHVYTMGTRAYAENVCKIIDPDGKYFANRILSRDESGSMVHKSLERLFPVDQSMVVVIDDRGDVWNWSPNLVKVIPYEFFVGIGDINGAFLPKKASPLPPGVAAGGASPSDPAAASSNHEIPPETLHMPLEDTAAAISAQNVELDQQVHDKPLAKMQEEKSAALHLEKAKLAVLGTGSTTNSRGTSEVPSEASSASVSPSKDSTTPHPRASASPAPSAATIGDAATTPTPTSGAAATASARSAAPTASGPNGIGASRFVAKSQTVDDEDSDSDTSSDEDGDDGEGESENKEESTPKVEESKDGVEPPKTPLSGVREREKIADESIDASTPTNGPKSEATITLHDLESDAAGSQISQEEEAVLQDHDDELDRVLAMLEQVHKAYYDGEGADQGGVPHIIPSIKERVLAGCHIVFSGVIPLDQDARRAEIWQMALQFGATCSNSLSSRTTHVVAAKSGTSKVNTARRQKSIQIVTPGWLLESVAKWERMPEEQYQLEMDASEDGQVSADTPLPSPNSPAPDPPDNGNEDDELDMLNEDDEDAGLHDIDWGDAEAEINAALDETDDDDDGTRSVDMNDEVSDAESTASSGGVRKRPRLSSTPSSTSVSGESPLAKRRKVAAARAGKSKLKMSDSIDLSSETSTPAPVQLNTLATSIKDEIVSSTVSSSTSSDSGSIILDGIEAGGDGEGGTDEDEDLDDFAKALEGELS